MISARSSSVEREKKKKKTRTQVHAYLDLCDICSNIFVNEARSRGASGHDDEVKMMSFFFVKNSVNCCFIQFFVSSFCAF